MSASKNKVIDKINAESKPKKAKPEPPVSQSVKEGEDAKPKIARSQRQKREAAVIAVNPEPVTIPVTIVPVVQPIVETVATIPIHEPAQAEPVNKDVEYWDNLKRETWAKLEAEQHAEMAEPEQPETVWQRWKKSGLIWWFGCAVLFLIATIVYLVIQNSRYIKQGKKVEVIETKISDDKAKLQQSEISLNELLNKRTDSVIKEVSSLMAEAVTYQKAWEATMQKINEKQKEENEKLQRRIDAANDDTLRRIGSELSGQ